MYKTLQTLRPLIDPATTNMTLEQISESYGASLKPSLLALAFEKLFPLMLNTAQHYFGLTLEDVASFALQELDYSLRSFEQGRQAFTTYSMTVFRNRLREETIANNQQKRSANQGCVDIDSLAQHIYEVDADVELVEFLLMLDSLNLTPRERVYCDYLMEGWRTRDISTAMDVSPARLSQFRKQLRKKLQPLVYEYAWNSIC
jgi:RNA polymerase sigma factor (sigma-70 family)